METKNSLKSKLTSKGINTDSWGTGGSKTLNNLLKEIKNGETVLVIIKDKILRQTIVAGANIYYGQYKLKQEKQVFSDGRTRKRNLKQAVTEKIKKDEDPKAAMIRGIREELDLGGEINITHNKTETEITPSPSYPGLETKYVLHRFDVTLSDEQFNPEGYIEKQENITTYFVWENKKGS